MKTVVAPYLTDTNHVSQSDLSKFWHFQIVHLGWICERMDEGIEGYFKISFCLIGVDYTFFPFLTLSVWWQWCIFLGDLTMKWEPRFLILKGGDVCLFETPPVYHISSNRTLGVS